jgi:hypothetical protein
MTGRLAVSPDGHALLRDGVPLPLVVDTAWSAFSDPTPDEFASYLRLRRQQGFTGVAVSTLPILHDRTDRAGARHPYARGEDGRYDWDRPDERYAQVMRDYTAAIAAEGLVPVLVVFWCNYVDGTWAQRKVDFPGMTRDAAAAHVRRVAALAEFDPVLVLAGDDDFRVPGAIDFYDEALTEIRRLAPGCLVTTHSAPGATIPASWTGPGGLDLFMFQSGHHVGAWLDNCSELGIRYSSYRPRRPVVNLEPVYEYHGRFDGHGRWTPAEVRQAAWTSVLSGASAGVGYAGHGIWQWHTRDGRFTNRAFSQEPLEWFHALALPAAYDIGLLAHLMREEGLSALDPAQEILSPGQDPAIRAAAIADRSLVALFLPSPTEVSLTLDAAGYTAQAWDLSRRAPLRPALRPVDGGALVEQLDVPGDSVVVLRR